MTQPSESNRQLTAKEIEDLLKANRVMYEFLAWVTHEVRTPTVAMVIDSEFMLQEKLGPINEEQRKRLTQINETGEFLLKVWNDLLVMSHVLFDELLLQIEEASLGQIVPEAISDTWDHWQLVGGSEKPIVEQNIPDALPNVWIDPLRVQQAITRIILVASNSIRHKEESKIILTGSYNDAWVNLTVTTTCKSPNYFPDLDTQLFFSRTIIEKHGGQLKVEKEEESELVISFTLPIDQNKPH